LTTAVLNFCLDCQATAANIDTATNVFNPDKTAGFHLNTFCCVRAYSLTLSSIISKIFGLEIAEAKAVFETPIELIAVKILASMRLHPLPFSHLQEPLQSDLDFLEQVIINNIQYTKD